MTSPTDGGILNFFGGDEPWCAHSFILYFGLYIIVMDSSMVFQKSFLSYLYRCLCALVDIRGTTENFFVSNSAVIVFCTIWYERHVSSTTYLIVSSLSWSTRSWPFLNFLEWCRSWMLYLRTDFNRLSITLTISTLHLLTKSS